MIQNPSPTEHYPSRPITQVKEKPIGTAKYQEPIFRRGQFQNQYIETIVTVYPLTHKHSVTKKNLVAVRFGQMNVVRFIDRELLYELTYFDLNQIRKQ